MPLGEPVDDLRELATAFTLVCGRRARDGAAARRAARASSRRTSACGCWPTACEQAGELIVIIGRDGRDRVRERRVLPRVRLLARGARLAAADRAGRARVARRHRGASSSACRRATGRRARSVDARAQGRQHVPGRVRRGADRRRRRPGHAFRRRHPRHHRGAAAARAARARRAAVGDRRVRLRRRARDQQPAAVGHRHARAGARPAARRRRCAAISSAPASRRAAPDGSSATC